VRLASSPRESVSNFTSKATTDAVYRFGLRNWRAGHIVRVDEMLTQVVECKG